MHICTCLISLKGKYIHEFVMELALCLSGGGYRAAMYHLGVLSYLEHVNMPQGGKLIDHIHTITSISGGALPAFQYMLCIADGRDAKEGFKELYSKLVSTNIGNFLTDSYCKKSAEGASLISCLADIYDEVFFHGEQFGKILDAMDWDVLHHFTVDATDFELGSPFRFQATCDISQIDGRIEPFGVVGNRRHKIDREDARHIRLADIMAATSCFPLVFEPITFPGEFKMGGWITSLEERDITYQLMDGGLVDNQGIDPAVHAGLHLIGLKKDLDVIILSDAGTTPLKNKNDQLKISKCSPNFWFWLSYILVWISWGAALACHLNSWHLACGLLLGLSSLFVAGCAFIKRFGDFAENAIRGKVHFDFKSSFMWNNSVNNIITFLKARVNTAYRMVDVVMMGHIKKVAYRGLIHDNRFENKVMMNSLSVFSLGGRWSNVLGRRNRADKNLTPSTELRNVSNLANKMDTTLWFTEDEIKAGVPQAVLACGQFTTCWNLLQHIDRLNGKDEAELTEGQKVLKEIEPILLGDWEVFNKNPYIHTTSYLR